MLRLTVRRDGKVHVLEFSQGFVQNRLLETVNGVEVSPMRVTGSRRTRLPRSSSTWACPARRRRPGAGSRT